MIIIKNLPEFFVACFLKSFITLTILYVCRRQQQDNAVNPTRENSFFTWLSS